MGCTASSPHPKQKSVNFRKLSQAFALLNKQTKSVNITSFRASTSSDSSSSSDYSSRNSGLSIDVSSHLSLNSERCSSVTSLSVAPVHSDEIKKVRFRIQVDELCTIASTRTSDSSKYWRFSEDEVPEFCSPKLEASPRAVSPVVSSPKSYWALMTVPVRKSLMASQVPSAVSSLSPRGIRRSSEILRERKFQFKRLQHSLKSQRKDEIQKDLELTLSPRWERTSTYEKPSSIPRGINPNAGRKRRLTNRRTFGKRLVGSRLL